MNLRAPQGVLLIRRRDGQVASALRLPRWGVAWLLALILGPAMFGCGYLGWHMHGRYGITGSRAHWDSSAVGERWPNFVQPGRIDPAAKALFERSRAAARALQLGLGRRSTASSLLRGHVEESWLAEVGYETTAGGVMEWPVPEGWFVRGYGSGTDGYHLAVDIAGPAGSDVLAAAPGLVGYAGNGVRGYGNLILLIHPGGGITMYAHNQHNLVRAGAHVRAGERIAELGNTGISRGPHVHFEFLRTGKSCDPLPLFRPGVPHRDGHLAQVPLAIWADGHKPRAIACAPRRRHPHSRWLSHRQIAVR